MNKVKTCHEEVSEASEKLGIPIMEIDKSVCDSLRDKLRKFAPSTISPPPRNAVRNDDAWRWIGNYVGEGKALLLFAIHLSRSIFEIEGGDNIVRILEETSCDPILITNHEVDYLLEYNDHAHLIAYGDAMEWLRQQAAVRGVPLIE